MIAIATDEQIRRRVGETGREADRFTAKRVAYLGHRYGLRSRYDRLRDRGMLMKKEMTRASASTSKRWTGGRSTESSKGTLTTTTDGSCTRPRGRMRRPNSAVDGIGWSTSSYPGGGERISTRLHRAGGGVV